MAHGLENKFSVEPQQSVWWREAADEAKKVRNLSAIMGTAILIPAAICATKWDSLGLLAMLFGAITTISYLNAAYITYGLATNKYKDTPQQ